jgi:hypothetical protein
MPSLAEINYAVQGLWRLAHLDEGGLQYFDRSVGGFWRSFRVAFLTAPVEALIFVTIIEHIALDAGWSRILTVEILSYIVDWFIYPVACFELCRWHKKTDAYVGYVVAYNWSKIIRYGLLLLAFGPLILGWVSPQGTVVFELLARFIWYGYLWFLTRKALGVDGLAAGGFVLLDFFLTQLVSGIRFQMMM